MRPRDTEMKPAGGPPPLEELLPHRPPMILLSGYDPASFTETSLSAWVDVTEDSLFYDASLGGVPAPAAIEYMAQTVACHVGLATRRKGEKPRIGFVLGSRALTLDIPAFLAGRRYRVESALLYEDAGFASFDVRITDESGRAAAGGVISAFRPDDPDALARAQQNEEETKEKETKTEGRAK